jgi:hypothetical protein
MVALLMMPPHIMRAATSDRRILRGIADDVHAARPHAANGK